MFAKKAYVFLQDYLKWKDLLQVAKNSFVTNREYDIVIQLLNGFRPNSLGELREACETRADGDCFDRFS